MPPSSTRDFKHSPAPVRCPLLARTSASLQRLIVRRVRLAALSCSSTRMRSAISASSLSFVASCNFKGMFPCEESRSSAAPLAPTSARDRAARASRANSITVLPRMAFQENRVRHWLRATSNVCSRTAVMKMIGIGYLARSTIQKIKPAHTLHLYVGDQTRAVVDPRRAQAILSGFRTRKQRNRAA